MKRSWLIFFLCFIALTLLASTIWTGKLWALSSWGAVSPLAGLICAILIIAQLFPKAPADPFHRIPTIPSAALRFLASAAVAIAVLWLLRSRHALWGERAALRSAIESGAYRPSAPLSTFLQGALYRFLNGVFLWSADSIQTLTSILAGLLYALFAIRAAGLLFTESKDDGERRLAAAFLLSSGFVALFFGAGGNVPVAMTLVLVFIVAELEYLRGACSPVVPAALLAAAILSHISSAFCVPAYLYSLAPASRSRETSKKAFIAAGALLLGWILLEIVVPRIGGKPEPARFLWAALADSARELQAGGWSGFANSLWTALNSLVIIGPASVVAVILLVTGRRASEAAPQLIARKEERFLFVCVLSALIMFIAGSHLLEEGLRWHALSSAGPAFSIYALWSLKRRFGERGQFARATWILVLLGAFHTLPLVIVDTVPRFAERRVLELPLTPGRGEGIIADAALGKGKLDIAHSWYLASIEKRPLNDVANARIGRIEMKQEEYSAAISHFLNAHELKPADPHYRFELAEALIAKRWLPEATAQLETLTTAYPDSVIFWRKLGFARNNGHRYEPAVAAYEKALALEPTNEENVRNLVSALLNRAAELQEKKKYDEARLLYDRAISLYPRDWRAYNNLAIIEMDLGRYEKAYDILTEALKLHPYESDLHFNLGIVLEKLGRPKEALAHMSAAQELDPVYSKAQTHIARLEKKLGIWRPARADSQRSPSKAP